MRPLTARGLAYGTRCLRLGDITYLPQPLNLIREYKRIIGTLWARDMISVSRPLSLTESYHLLQGFEHRANAQWRNGREPLWIRMIPPKLQCEWRRNFEIEECDPLAICPNIPRTGIGYLVHEGGLADATTDTFNLFRLSRIKQLGYLHDALASEMVVIQTEGLDFRHTRWGHVLDVMAIIGLIAARNGLSDHLQTHARVAALTHDALTPAGGDSIKLIDPAAFDEDANYGEIFKTPGWPALRDTYALDAQLLTDTVQGNGVLGTLLDLADKLAYVARDTMAFLLRIPELPPDLANLVPQGHHELYDLVAHRPFICSLWDAVRIKKDRVIITDPDRLGWFLMLRALLFRELYFHPGARFREFMFSKVIVEYLYRTRRVNHTDLLRMDDDELEKCINKTIGISYAHTQLDAIGTPKVEVFTSIKEARQRENALLAQEVTFTFIEELHRTANPGTHFLVCDHKGPARPFFEARPEITELINAVITPRDPVRLYYLQPPYRKISPEFLVAYRQFRRRGSQ